MAGDEERVRAQLMADAEPEEVELVLQRARQQERGAQDAGDEAGFGAGAGRQARAAADHGMGASMRTASPNWLKSIVATRKPCWPAPGARVMVVCWRIVIPPFFAIHTSPSAAE